MADILFEELEIRVGTEVLDSLTKSQVKEFETVISTTKDAELEKVRSDWIAAHYPDFDKTVTAQKIKLSRQIRAAKNKPAFIRSLSVE